MPVDLKGNWTDADIAKLMDRLRTTAIGVWRSMRTVSQISPIKRQIPPAPEYDETLRIALLKPGCKERTLSAHQLQATRSS